QNFDRNRYQSRIDSLESELNTSATRLTDLERTLHQARAAETEPLEPTQGYRGTRAAIARQLRDERAEFGWLIDPIPFGTPCPNYAGQWQGLAAYHRGLDAQMRIGLARECVELPFCDEAVLDEVRAIGAAKRMINPPLAKESLQIEVPASALPTDLAD